MGSKASLHPHAVARTSDVDHLVAEVASERNAYEFPFGDVRTRRKIKRVDILKYHTAPCEEGITMLDLHVRFKLRLRITFTRLARLIRWLVA